MIEIHIGTRPHDTSILIDGVDISGAVRSIQIEQSAGDSFAQVLLDLAMIDVTALDAVAPEYALTNATREALESMGWTPPSEKRTIPVPLLTEDPLSEAQRKVVSLLTPKEIAHVRAAIANWRPDSATFALYGVTFTIAKARLALDELDSAKSPE